MNAKPDGNIDVKRDAEQPAVRSADVFGALRSEIDRLFDDFTWPGIGLPAARHVSRFGPMRDWMPDLARTPAMDLIERDGGYELSVELPGLSRDDIELRMTDGTLSVKGEKTEEKKEAKGDYHMSERRYGTVQRSIAMPRGVDPDKVVAKFENGVLKVTLPKSETAKASERKIEVSAA